MVKEALRIATILKWAIELSKKYDDANDSGPSNLDVCCITLDKSLIGTVSSLSGVDLSMRRNGSCCVYIDYKGQGYRRTKKAEAISHYLKSKGLSTFVEYNID